MKFATYLEENKISVQNAATELGITRQRIYQLKNGSRASPELALRVEHWTKGEVPRDMMLYPLKR
jgi:plasmid maintenance system antidote protein VapI